MIYNHFLSIRIQCEPVHRELRRKGKDPVKEPYFWASKESYTLGDLEDRLFLKPKEETEKQENPKQGDEEMEREEGKEEKVPKEENVEEHDEHDETEDQEAYVILSDDEDNGTAPTEKESQPQKEETTEVPKEENVEEHDEYDETEDQEAYVILSDDEGNGTAPTEKESQPQKEETTKVPKETKKDDEDVNQTPLSTQEEEITQGQSSLQTPLTPVMLSQEVMEEIDLKVKKWAKNKLIRDLLSSLEEDEKKYKLALKKATLLIHRDKLPRAHPEVKYLAEQIYKIIIVSVKLFLCITIYL
uniref:Uncharacterized protein At2g07260 n=1 Tax=Arabidopsis thaliana TaxID=3702 RepID=Q9ZQL5_ARATH|nr:hypothetical protein [Arabidopsis thaliana]